MKPLQKAFVIGLVSKRSDTMLTDFLEALGKILLITCIILLPISATGMYYEWKDCHDRGGELVGTGEYTTTVNMAGKVPVPSKIENKECSK
ncbi:hypothetical protein BC01_064 [Bacillus phage BC01]|nr:hypothetical protein PBC6_057 [Bacillus phage PBC6]AXU41161.1 hypothetical protein BC01_064 [Bacillus phage BC01]